MLNKILGVLVVSVGVLALPACADVPGDDGQSSVDDGQSSVSQADTASGWTPWTSEEFPPINCTVGSLVNAARCSGSYCDNVGLYCLPTGRTVTSNYWTASYSDENVRQQLCPTNPNGQGDYWVTGAACTGRYCDNVSLQCSQMLNTHGTDCYWTATVSEENGGQLNFPPGYYARGGSCSGSYCDNMAYYICRL